MLLSHSQPDNGNFSNPLTSNTSLKIGHPCLELYDKIYGNFSPPLPDVLLLIFLINICLWKHLLLYVTLYLLKFKHISQNVMNYHSELSSHSRMLLIKGYKQEFFLLYLILSTNVHFYLKMLKSS